MRIKRKGENKPTHAFSFLLGNRKLLAVVLFTIYSTTHFDALGMVAMLAHVHILGIPSWEPEQQQKIQQQMLRYLCVSDTNWLSSLYFYAISSGNIINFAPHCFRITAAGAFEQEILMKNSQILATLYIDWYTNGVFVLTLINKIHLIKLKELSFELIRVE